MKGNYKILVAFMLGLLFSVIGVYAADTIIESKYVSYNNEVSGSEYTNVQDSIDDLYTKAGLLKEEWKDPILNGADPVLEVEGSNKKLIPVTISSEGEVKYANLKTEWYNYSEKRWANAVILVDNPKNGGEENYTYKTGDIIDEEDIESYFVWIPRFKYKIWNISDTNMVGKDVLTNGTFETSISQALGKTRKIDVVFESKEKAKSGYSNGVVNSNIKVGDYLTHPAFTLGNKELNGIWVGKFETGYNQNTKLGNPITVDDSWTKEKAEKSGVESNKIIIKPNVYSWRSNSVKNFFLSSFNYARELESHMMKNTEWGAVAYLSHSVYGLGGEVNINNNKNFITGYSSAPNLLQNTLPGSSGEAIPKENTDETQSYNTPSGYLASTTGNISGVYDMSGGVFEYMAAYVSGQVGASGFELNDLTETYKNYFDVYPANESQTNYGNRILGDATGEMGPFYEYYDSDTLRYHNSWYGDGSFFIYSRKPWFVRGGCYNDGLTASQFNFFTEYGAAPTYYGIRVVLSI